MTVYAKIDLHTHTTASDGTDTPSQLVTTALERGLRVLAITDHDSMEGIPEAMASIEGASLEVWPGVEISADVPGGEVHILGYLVDYSDAALQDTLRTMRGARVGRARKMTEKLAELGVPVEWQRVQEIAGDGTVGRPHVAQALLEKGHISSIAEAFQRFIGRSGPAYVERYQLTPAEAVQLIVRARGFAALAHPIGIGPSPDPSQRLDLDVLLPQLVPAGLDGLEVYYPGHSVQTIEQLLRVANHWGLVPTGGTDYHGRGVLTMGIGEVPVPDAAVEKIRQRHDWRQTGAHFNNAAI